MTTVLKLLYFADPMCSWCWGNAAVISRIRTEFAGRLEVEPIMGGLRAGTTRAMPAEQIRQIQGYWTRVAKETGQAFGTETAMREGFVYDTEPSCRAVVLMRRQRPEVALDYLHALQSAFYAEGRDITRPETLLELALPWGVNAETWAAELDAEAARAAARDDFEFTQDAGISGFPSTVLQLPERRRLVAVGYLSYEDTLRQLQRWMPTAPGPVH